MCVVCVELEHSTHTTHKDTCYTDKSFSVQNGTQKCTDFFCTRVCANCPISEIGIHLHKLSTQYAQLYWIRYWIVQIDTRLILDYFD